MSEHDNGGAVTRYSAVLKLADTQSHAWQGQQHGCSYSFVNRGMPFARSNREMLTPGLSTGGLQPVRSAVLRLGGLGHPVPHDRLGDLQPLSRQRFECLAVWYSPFSAPGVVVAPLTSLCYRPRCPSCSLGCSCAVMLRAK